jgi:hypothetical protein
MLEGHDEHGSALLADIAILPSLEMARNDLGYKPCEDRE